MDTKYNEIMMKVILISFFVSLVIAGIIMIYLPPMEMIDFLKVLKKVLEKIVIYLVILLPTYLVIAASAWLIGYISYSKKQK